MVVVVLSLVTWTLGQASDDGTWVVNLVRHGRTGGEEPRQASALPSVVQHLHSYDRDDPDAILEHPHAFTQSHTHSSHAARASSRLYTHTYTVTLHHGGPAASDNGHNLRHEEEDAAARRM